MKKNSSQLILILVLFTMGSFINVFAATAGTAGAPFLKIPIGAKPVSMGESCTATGNNIYGMYFNPANLAIMKNKEVAASHIIWIEDTAYDSFSFGYPVKNFGTVALGYNIFSYGTLYRTFDSPDIKGTFTASDTLAVLSYAKNLSSKFAFGINLKQVSQNYDTYSNSNFLMDIGILGISSWLPETMPIGISINNIGSGFKVDKSRTDSDAAPMEFKIGTGMLFMTGKLKLSTDLSSISDSKPALGFGAEYGIMNNIIQIRGGYKYKFGGNDLGMTSGLRFGFGVNLYDTALDYAFAPQGDLGVTHRVSVTYAFGTDIIGQKVGIISLDTNQMGETGEEIVRVRKEIVYFAPTDDITGEEHMIVIKKAASIYEANPEFTVKVEGHNDIRENTKTSRSRTENVKKALMSFGVPENKIYIKWYGASKPVSTAISKEGLAHNRRVEIIIWGRETVNPEQ